MSLLKNLKLKTNNLKDQLCITGIACTFPKAHDSETYWQNLSEANDCIQKVPKSRWDVSTAIAKFGGFVDDIEYFDNDFFGISFVEAANMDPQQRFVLEQGYLALNQAGFDKSKLVGEKIGVIVGICGSDLARFVDEPSVYAATGNAHSIVANRFSYVFGLTGPSLAIDTACSSSLVAIDVASLYIKAGHCKTAVVIGVNALLAQFMTDTFTVMKMMASDGRCKTFDATANGYVRGEGCGAVVVEPYTTKKFTWAIIAGTAINQDGKTASMTAPSGPRQEECLQKALKSAKIQPESVSYVECHGTGTPLGDPIEIGALFEAYGNVPNRRSPLIVGSVKTNIGHTEGAAGIAGLIKLALSLHHKTIPQTLHLNIINPEIKTHMSKNLNAIQFATQRSEWNEPVRYGGVSSFGFGGTNAHIILRNAPENQMSVPETKPIYNKKYFEPLWNRIVEKKQKQDQNIDDTGKSKIQFDQQLYDVFKHHRVQNRVIFPGAGYLSRILEDASVFQTIQFHQPYQVEQGATLEISDEIFSYEAGVKFTMNNENIDVLQDVDVQELYVKLAHNGLQYTDSFQGIVAASIGDKIVKSTICVPFDNSFEESISLLLLIRHFNLCRLLFLQLKVLSYLSVLINCKYTKNILRQKPLNLHQLLLSRNLQKIISDVTFQYMLKTTSSLKLLILWLLKLCHCII